ncbi:MAG: Uncharacterized protein G01um101444_37 [Parcubacteria group bacterium Gr01-1014_44]|nr:MAG: Uncharacterized protein G01um101444_37 [Parcubacteria group bacterium Gr01-1014_44]
MVKTINQAYQEKYQQEKKRKIFRKVFLFLVLFFGLAGGTVYALFFSNLFNISEINISNSGFVKNQEIRSLVDSYLSQQKLFIPRFNSIFLANASQISAMINREFPAAENIKVKKRYFHALEISLDYKKAVGVWCYKTADQCFYFDRSGAIFDAVTETSGSLLVNIMDEKGSFENLGQPAADPALVNLIFETKDRLEKIKIGVFKFVVPAEEDFRLDIQTVEGWKIYLSTKDDLVRQFKSLEVFLAQKITSEKRSQLQYIDLTVPNRVYYK